MCNAASFIITQSAVFWSEKSDSHEEIILENGLDDSGVKFVRAEISPPNDVYSLPLEHWVFKTDQEIVPDWYASASAESACRAELPKWAALHIITEGDYEIDGGNISRVVFGGHLTIKNMAGGECWFYGSSTGTVSAQAGGLCWFSDSSTGTVSAQAGGECRFYGNAKEN